MSEALLGDNREEEDEIYMLDERAPLIDSRSPPLGSLNSRGEGAAGGYAPPQLDYALVRSLSNDYTC